MEYSNRVIPFVPILDELDLSSNSIVLEKHGLRLPIMCNNWKDHYPYTPITVVDLAYTDKGLYFRFYSKGIGLQAKYSEDGSPVHKDSCVEAFIQLIGDRNYYNLEFNCIGVCDASKRLNRKVETPFTSEQYAMIHRATSESSHILFERSIGIHEFFVSVRVDFKLFGLDINHLPNSIKANFFKCGDDCVIPHFLSWMPIDAPTPDFHRPESFHDLFFAPKR